MACGKYLYMKLSLSPHQPPIHKPVVVRLGDNSDSEDDEVDSRTASLSSTAATLVSNLDSFLKETRKEVEVQNLASTVF